MATWNIRRLREIGALINLVKQVEANKVDILAIQDVRRVDSGLRIMKRMH